MIWGAIAVAACVHAVVTFVRQVRWEHANDRVRDVEVGLIAKMGTDEELTEQEHLLLWELNAMSEEQP